MFVHSFNWFTMIASRLQWYACLFCIAQFMVHIYIEMCRQCVYLSNYSQEIYYLLTIGYEYFFSFQSFLAISDFSLPWSLFLFFLWSRRTHNAPAMIIMTLITIKTVFSFVPVGSVNYFPIPNRCPYWK